MFDFVRSPTVNGMVQIESGGVTYVVLTLADFTPASYSFVVGAIHVDGAEVRWSGGGYAAGRHLTTDVTDYSKPGAARGILNCWKPG